MSNDPGKRFGFLAGWPYEFRHPVIFAGTGNKAETCLPEFRDRLDLGETPFDDQTHLSFNEGIEYG